MINLVENIALEIKVLKGFTAKETLEQLTGPLNSKKLYPILLTLSCGCKKTIDATDLVYEKKCGHGNYFIKISHID